MLERVVTCVGDAFVVGNTGSAVSDFDGEAGLGDGVEARPDGLGPIWAICGGWSCH